MDGWTDIRESNTLKDWLFSFLLFISVLKLYVKTMPLGCRDGSVVESTDCSSRGPEFKSQHPYGNSQLPIMPRSDTITRLFLESRATPETWPGNKYTPGQSSSSSTWKSKREIHTWVQQENRSRGSEPAQKRMQRHWAKPESSREQATCTCTAAAWDQTAGLVLRPSASFPAVKTAVKADSS